ncbi:MAG: hypothetical protein ACJASJ_001354, partial [Candidatus Azotimanducaceae bacterium]
FERGRNLEVAVPRTGEALKLRGHHKAASALWHVIDVVLTRKLSETVRSLLNLVVNDDPSIKIPGHV